MPMTAPIRNVFIVDDDPSMHEALAVVFTLAGYRVSLFPDAESFLAAVPMKAPAALLIDVHLPRLSGLELLARLDAGRYGAPIVMISADADVAHAVEAVKRGAFDYMVKPLDGRRLVESIDGAIAGGASNKEAGRKLGISPRTIEVHRTRIMKKTGARNAADLVRIVLHGTDGDHNGPGGPAPEMVA
jgi:two-component system, LuxR family, response regulator FixJ